MEIVSISETDILNVASYIEKYDSKLIVSLDQDAKNELFMQKCGELAFMKYGLNNRLFLPTAGGLVHEAVLDPSVDPIHSHGILLDVNDMKYKHMRIVVDVHVVKEKCNAIYLDTDEYDEHLNKAKWFPIDMFVLVKKLSESTYDIAGFIEKEEAFKYYKNCNVAGDSNAYYCIDEKFMKTSFINCMK